VTLDADRSPRAVARRLLRGRPPSGRRRSTAIRPRSGSTGGWRDLFDVDDEAFFDAEAAEAMHSLGYG